VIYDDIVYIPDDYEATYKNGDRLYVRLEGTLGNNEGEFVVDIVG